MTSPLTLATTPPIRSTGAGVTGVRSYRLSPWVSLRPVDGGLQAHALLSGGRLSLTNPSRLSLFLAFLRPVRLDELLAGCDDDKTRAVLAFVRHCRALGLLIPVAEEVEVEGGVAEPDSLAHWEFHDLLFHLTSRGGRNPAPLGATHHLRDAVPPEPAVKDPGKDDRDVTLPEPASAGAPVDSATLDQVLKARRTRYSVAPVTLEQLAELLSRSCLALQSPDDGGTDFVRKVYPSGGSLHPLEVYVVAARCPGLEPGVYHYRSVDHALRPVSGFTDEVRGLLRDARTSAQHLPDLPSVLMVVTARFRRVSRKYQSIAYRLILEEVGALYQTWYLVATDMGLAPCALGAGDSDRFARATGIDYFAETSVGEFLIGGRGA